MLKTKNNPGGLPISVFDQIRAGVVADRSQFFKDLSIPFYGYNKPDAKISQGVRDSFWLQGMQASIKGVYDCGLSPNARQIIGRVFGYFPPQGAVFASPHLALRIRLG